MGHFHSVYSPLYFHLLLLSSPTFKFTIYSLYSLIRILYDNLIIYPKLILIPTFYHLIRTLYDLVYSLIVNYD